MKANKNRPGTTQVSLISMVAILLFVISCFRVLAWPLRSVAGPGPAYSLQAHAPRSAPSRDYNALLKEFARARSSWFSTEERAAGSTEGAARMRHEAGE